MRYFSRISALAMLAVLLLITACKKEKTDTAGPDPVQPLRKGFVEGTVYSINGSFAIPHALVFADVAGEVYINYTDSDGHFRIELPEGDHELHIQTGKGNLFRMQIPIHVTADATVSIPGGSALLPLVADLAYIPGAFDRIENIIIDSLGYSATAISMTDLSGLSTISTYEAIFLNCGGSGVMDSAKYANLRTYVENGGSLYASDWAVQYISGDGNYKTSPSHDAPVNKVTTCMPRIGGMIHDSLLCTEKMGGTGLIVGADVVAPDIQTVLGHTTTDILYDLGGWEMILDLKAPWETLISHPSVGPMAIRISNLGTGSGSGGTGGSGSSGWVTICHIPPGNPYHPVTITISSSALAAHLAHGCYIGSCNANSGTIYYTTFHNHPYAPVSEDVEKILSYFVLNL